MHNWITLLCTWNTVNYTSIIYIKQKKQTNKQKNKGQSDKSNQKYI